MKIYRYKYYIYAVKHYFKNKLTVVHRHHTDPKIAIWIYHVYDSDLRANKKSSVYCSWSAFESNSQYIYSLEYMKISKTQTVETKKK